MRPGHLADGRSSATYEIQLQGSPPEALMARFTPTRVARTPAQTVLMRRITSQDELASLLDRVLAVGLVLNDVHELRVASRAPNPTPRVAGQRTVYRAYEVRVDGKLDGALLRYLRWHHRHLPEHAAVWLDGTAEEVHEFLSACCSLGLGIEQVRRVSAFIPTEPQPATRT
jgi:hypothetical protein